MDINSTSRRQAVAFDTETTGLIDNQTVKLDKLPEVIEFYGCLFDVDSGELLEELDLLIKPKGSLNLQVTGLKTIKEEMVADKLPFSVHASDIKALLEKAPLVIAHNLAYDKEMIDVEMKRCGFNIEWPRGICTVEQTMHIKGYRLNLGDLHLELLGESFEGAHRAKVDVLAMVRCVVELYKRGDL